MERVRVTGDYQVTIPAAIRERLGIEEGDVLEVYLRGDEIVLKKVKTSRPRIRLGRELTLEEIERAIEVGEGAGTRWNSPRKKDINLAT